MLLILDATLLLYRAHQRVAEDLFNNELAVTAFSLALTLHAQIFTPK